MPKLHIDIETYCEVDLKTAGLYRYVEHESFEILLIAYAIDDQPVVCLDLTKIEEPDSIGAEDVEAFIWCVTDGAYQLHAHNATFERIALNKYLGLNIPADRWFCSMAKSAYCGLPLSLGAVSKELNLVNGKLKIGTSLINYFSKPCKPSKANGGRVRNLPDNDPAKWNDFISYCIGDVEAEREIYKRLKGYAVPDFEREVYLLDQAINDHGVLIDLELAENAQRVGNKISDQLIGRLKDLTGLDNPNSLAQLKQWIQEVSGEKIKSITKGTIDPLIEDFEGETVGEALSIRKKLGKTSVKKYDAMLNTYAKYGRSHGLFQYYGANRTGRWSGRLIQLQNLPRNYLKNLDFDREAVKLLSFEELDLIYANLNGTLSQLIRTAFIAPEGKVLAVADFSAIEARVIAWLAGEDWRLKVFNTHGKIYEASASMMFGVPIEQIGKESDLRQKGKIAELALGYQGAIGALTQMGGEQMGLSENEMQTIVNRWRKANPAIVQFWDKVEKAAIQSVKHRKAVKYKNLVFITDDNFLRIVLPSGRALFYHKPGLTKNKWGKTSITYRGSDQGTRNYVKVDTYGGKLTENITQAVARDLLAYAMLDVSKEGFKINLHVHDEIAAEVDELTAQESLTRLCEIMRVTPDWAAGLPLDAEGFISKYYKK